MNSTNSNETKALYERIIEMESQLKDRQDKLDEIQEDSKNTMKDIHQKWANFVGKTLDVAKAYRAIFDNYKLKQEDYQQVDFLDQQVRDFEQFLHSSLEELFFDDN